MKYLRIMLMAFLASVLAACGGGGDSTSTTSAKGILSVQMTDAPAAPEYKEVWVTVEKVRVHMSDTADPNAEGWQEIVLSPAKKIDLLKLRNGVLAELGQIEVPVGQYHQFRLVLGSQPGDNELVLAGGSTEPLPLSTPSAQTSGLKLNAKPFTVGEGQLVEIVLDFDAARSIVKAGNSGKYNLKPVITVIPVLDAGAVAGSFADVAVAANASVSLQVYDPVTEEVTVLRSTTPAVDGTWKLAPVYEGSNYNLVVTKPGYRPLVLTGVPVVAGEILAIDPIALTPVEAVTGGTPPVTTFPTMRVLSGDVDPAGPALVRVLQKVVDPADLANDIVVELAFQNADAVTGEFAFPTAPETFGLTVEPAEVGTVGGTLGDGANAGIFIVVAVGDNGPGLAADVDLNGGDVTGLTLPLAP